MLVLSKHKDILKFRNQACRNVKNFQLDLNTLWRGILDGYVSVFIFTFFFIYTCLVLNLNIS